METIFLKRSIVYLLLRMQMRNMLWLLIYHLDQRNILGFIMTLMKLILTGIKTLEITCLFFQKWEVIASIVIFWLQVKGIEELKIGQILNAHAVEFFSVWTRIGTVSLNFINKIIIYLFQILHYLSLVVCHVVIIEIFICH